MEVRENLIKLCEKIGDGHYKITPDCAEYKVFEKWITDEQIALLMAIKGAMKPNFLGGIARRAGMPKDKARTMLQELTEIGLLVQVLVPKIGLEIYLQPLYTPGVFEFLLLNEPFCRAHPEIAYAFEQHATDSQTEHAMNTPMGAGIMRVIPVEAAIPAEAQQIDNERVSHYIELNADHLCALPCQCRRVRKLMNEGVKFIFEHKPVELKGAKGKVTELVCDKGTVKCSAVIAAIGQTADWGKLDIGALEKNAKGYAVADGMTYQTAQPDIFVGGDIYTGPKFAIDAIAAGKQGAISIHRYVQEGQSLTIGRDRLEYRSLDKDNLDFDGIRADYDSTPRQVPHTVDVASFKDNRQTFTEEQLKKETARCLGCGASVVDPNKCLGCGICTTRCKFDAIHLRKRTNVESIEYPLRKKVLPEFRAERQQKIQIRKLRQEK